jgi:hypothetical protein
MQSTPARLITWPLAALAALAVLLGAPSAWACPDCATGQVVRDSLFQQGFWTQLGLLALPLLLVCAIALGLHGIGAQRGPR